MPRTSSAKRYAQAAFELALERNELESWQESLQKTADIAKDEELMALLQNPRLSFDAKKGLLQKRLGEINPLASNLALLLVSKGLLRISADISQQYNDLLDAHRGIERARVTTAFPLDDDEIKAISRRLGEIIEHKVIIDAHVDASIIGGFIARMGDKLIDGSIHQKLETLKKSLVEVGR
ncbi:MAG: ATP synthase F1 subunit delta [Thermodesulfobacteriota bacterium]|jgi:F-type H+-transporting ATPase subunit delta